MFFDICNAEIAQWCQKIGRHFSNNWILELKLAKNVLQKCGPKLILFNKKKFRKIQTFKNHKILTFECQNLMIFERLNLSKLFFY